jgi:RNA polymerase sigma-70 factor, ECF subfamily
MSDDHRTIQRVLGGDIDDYRLLVEKYKGPLLAIIRNMLSCTADCEDIAQETFLAAYLHLRSYDCRESKFSTWLFTIARNRCLNEAKRRKPANIDSIAPSSTSGDPAESLIVGEIADALDRALNSLPFEQKCVFILAEIHELPLEEVARIEATPVGTVKSRLSRAKEKLRSMLLPTVE